jgi:hypothetical protein
MNRGLRARLKNPSTLPKLSHKAVAPPSSSWGCLLYLGAPVAHRVIDIAPMIIMATEALTTVAGPIEEAPPDEVVVAVAVNRGFSEEGYESKWGCERDINAQLAIYLT